MYSQAHKKYYARKKEEKGRLKINAQTALLDMNFAMVLSEENQGPIVIKKETADNIIEILKKIQEL